MSDVNDAFMSNMPMDGADPFDDVVEEGDFDDVPESDDIEASADEDESEDAILASEDDEEPAEENSDEDSEESEEPEEVEAKDDEENSEEVKEEGEGESEEPLTLESLNEKILNGDLEIKIDEETTATLKDLKNDFIGRQEISRRFTNLDKEQKQHQRDVEEVNEYVNKFAGYMKNGDSVGAMQYMGQFSGMPPYMIKEQLIAALAPEVMRRQQMSDMELQNEQLQSHNEFLKQQSEIEGQRRIQEQADLDLQNSINSLREAQNIDEDTWNSTYEGLKQNPEIGDNVTPELVAETVAYGRMYEQAETVVKDFGDTLEDAEAWVERLVDVKEKNPEFTDADLKDIVEDVLNKLKVSSTEQKLAKKVQAKKKVEPKKQNKSTQSEETDDLDPELEDWL